MQVGSQERNTGSKPKLGVAERDIITMGIALAAIIMFVGTGSSVLSRIAQAMAGQGGGPDKMLTNALLLNIALVIFGWRRYRDLTSEVSERRKAEEQARILAETDPLTGCFNRRSIGPMTDQAIADAHTRGRAVVVLMVDLDSFKQVNDVHGHSVGDGLLRESATRIAGLLPADAILARFGGDEFACVIPFDPGRAAKVDELAESLIREIAKPVNCGTAEVETTISLGLVRSDKVVGNADAQALLHMADIAMYQAKKDGRNRFVWFDPSMEIALRYRSELESGIRRGIPAGEFVPYFEKQIDLSSGDLVGFEMLARWNSPKFGIVGPDVFIPIAEEIGVIADLSENLIAQALQVARRWNPKLTLSVNISPVQLRDPWFAQKLLKLMVAANFPPERLDVEITENSLHENIGLVRSLITSLKNQGVSVSLDDFGTGYSSLSQLHSLPFNRIKIDRSFVGTVNDSAESATIIQSIIALGDGLGLPITAEGIETEAVLARMRELGKFKGQGYLYGQPKSAAVTEAELAQLDLLLEPAIKPEAAKKAVIARRA